MSPKPKSRTKAPEAVDDLSFEQAYKELEAIVRKLEGGQLALDDSLALFERGQALAAHCGALLADAELKISKLLPKAAEGYALEEFEESDD